MRVFVTGASGFIGSALVDALLARGHSVVAGVHYARATKTSDRVSEVPVDFMHDTDPKIWMPRLAHVDAVVNTVGILREYKDSTFEQLHERAPVALFGACELGGVERCIQVSALGADDEAISAYHLTKRGADQALRGSSLAWTIVQPSLVIGSKSASTQLFAMLASLPLIPLVGRGDQSVQPIHIDDLVELLIRLIEQRLAVRETVAIVGPQAMSLRKLLNGLRSAMGLFKTMSLAVPVPLIRMSARFGDWIGHGALSGETLAMLLRGNTAEPEGTRALLGRMPVDSRKAISAEHGRVLRIEALHRWLKPLVHGALAFMWISTGIVSWLFAQDIGPSLINELGIPQQWTMSLFAGACGVNVLLGLLSLTSPSRYLWVVQFLIVAFYTVALTLVSPELWYDPFGPLVKNFPIMVLLIGLINVEAAR